jgi:hypothetical protein
VRSWFLLFLVPVLAVVAGRRLRAHEDVVVSGGGRYGVVCRCGCSRATESSVESGLAWLARHQSLDGRWSAASFDQGCAKTHCGGRDFSWDDERVTSLAVLALLGAGYTPQNRASYTDPVDGSTRHLGQVVRRGLAWLCSEVDGRGSIGPSDRIQVARQALGTLALVHGYSVTGSVSYRAPAQRAIDSLVASRAHQGGFGFVPGASSPDAFVTATALLALHEAGKANLEVPAGLAFVPEGDATSRLLVRALSEPLAPDDRDVEAVVSAPITLDGPRLLFAGLALHRPLLLSSAPVKAWGQKVGNALSRAQETKLRGCASGSWTGPQGRVVATASAVLALEAYYRYASVPLPEKDD